MSGARLSQANSDDDEVVAKGLFGGFLSQGTVWTQSVEPVRDRNLKKGLQLSVWMSL